MLRKEFDILISLQHPNIVSALSCEEIPGMGYCIVMEWIDGRTLGDFIKEQEESNEYGESIRSIVMQLLDALEYIHAKQIVHRDLKPANIMVTYNGNRVKLIDFGLSDADSYAILKQPAGTRRYISPEQATSRQTDIRNDIYSLGCILEDMRLGKRYAAVIARCKAPMAGRFANVAELRQAFIAAGRKSHRNVIVLSVCAVVAVLAMGGYLFIPGNGNMTQPKNNKTAASVKQHQERMSAENKNITVLKSDKNPETKALTEQKTSENKVSYANASESNELALLAEGKKHIDNMWQKEGVAELTSTAEKSEAFSRFVEQSNDFITTTFPDEYCSAASKEIRTALVYQLSEYTAKKYVRPTLDELKK